MKLPQCKHLAEAYPNENSTVLFAVDVEHATSKNGWHQPYHQHMLAFLIYVKVCETCAFSSSQNLTA